VSAERQGDEAVLRVRDNGIGIRADKLPTIFDLFVQAERRLDRSQGGIGIGLTMVKKKLVELHGGAVEARSKGPGKGSEFVVRLPALARQPAPGRGDSDGDRPPAAPLPSWRILVVDDNVDAADSLALMLRLAGQEVRAAYDGPTALAVAQAFRPQVFVLDLGMPGRDGYALARRLREQPEFRDGVLIALSGWGQEEDRRRSRDRGFDYHHLHFSQLAELPQAAFILALIPFYHFSLQPHS
jgi:CheY-like chemotaxis protein